jgi:NAD(P)-dependent dehydrogenase (short-subunit alcohol dehydrogenase family)
MTRLLDGKTCIIAGAGAAKGIGQATARLFAEHGARLVLADKACPRRR